MKLTFLGTGTSGGVPSLGCDCKVCRSTDPHDKRFRCAALLETDTTRILIDCGPDIRQQLLTVPFRQIDGVLLTHIHYDHVAGIDDLRPFCKFGDINIYANESTVRGLKQTMPYCFTDKLYPGVPLLRLHTIVPHKHIMLGDVDVLPIQVMHDWLPILGFRFGKFAYITDMKTIDASELKYLRGVETLVVNALRFEKEHHSHQLVDDAIKFARKVGAKQTYFVHVTHLIGLHDDANRRLPEGFQFAYDGLVIDV
jgi:phosphoribosyl 1,2-cyclic phosphate phosphodiesterase